MPERSDPGTTQNEARSTPIRNFVNASGRIDVDRVGVSTSMTTDLYHFLYTTTWPRLLGSFVVVWLGINALFAMLYQAGGPCIDGADGSFRHAFFFSVQTMSTIGYGGMTPATDWAELLVTAQAVIGIITTAMITGLVFAKFARPTARVLFSDPMVLAEFDGRPALMFRVANARDSQLVEAMVHLTLLYDQPTADGKPFRHIQDLELRRDTSPIFALTWTVVHYLDGDSPLAGKTLEELEALQATFIATLRGTDEVLVHQVHARHVYGFWDIRPGHSFVDVMSPREGGGITLDYTKFHLTEPPG